MFYITLGPWSSKILSYIHLSGIVQMIATRRPTIRVKKKMATTSAPENSCLDFSGSSTLQIILSINENITDKDNTRYTNLWFSIFEMVFILSHLNNFTSLNVNLEALSSYT